MDKIIQAACDIEGVINIHQVVADYVGPQLRVDMHVDVDGSLPFHRAHHISDAVQDAVEMLDEVDLAFIHLEPAEHSRISS